MENDLDLIIRFINDCKLPMQPIISERYPYYFRYMIDLLEDEFSAKTKWDNLKKVIVSEFGGNDSLFISEFYKTRENIIQTVKNDPKYIEFNNGSMDEYKLLPLPQYSKGNIYRNDMIGKRFLSIDLRKANFQALKYSGVLEDKTYEDFIRRFTNLDYIIDSKYLRVVVFGQLNPSRHITVEKYLISKIYNYLDSIALIPADKLTLLKLESDELIFIINDDSYIPDTKKIIEFVSSDCGLDIKAETFNMRGYNISYSESAPKIDFYAKSYLDGKKDSYHCIPGIYYPIIYKLIKGEEIIDMDRIFEHDGQLSMLLGNYTLKEVGK